MIDLKQAYDIALAAASKQYSEVELLDCTDIVDRYAFAFGAEGKPLIGAPVYTINKSTGELGYLVIPPLENLKLLKSGVKIDISQLKNE